MVTASQIRGFSVFLCCVCQKATIVTCIFSTIFDMKLRGKISSRLTDTIKKSLAPAPQATPSNIDTPHDLYKRWLHVLDCEVFCCHGERVFNVYQRCRKASQVTASQQTKGFKNTNAHALVHSAYMLTQRKQRTCTDRHRETLPATKMGSRGLFGWFSLHLTSVKPPFIQHANRLPACWPQNIHRPQDESHIGATSCTSTVIAQTSAPKTDAFKDNGWLLKALECSLVKITETWFKIDSLEELQIDIMWLIIAYSTQELFWISARKKYP